MVILLLILNSCSKPSTPTDLSFDVTDKTYNQSCSYLYFLLGNRAELYHEPEQALAAYQKALECAPETEYLETKIPLMLIRSGKVEEAISSLEEKIAQTPDQRGLVILLANLYSQQQDINKAIELYDTILQKNPDDLAILLRVGLLYFEKKQYGLAKKSFQHILDLDSANYNGHLYLAHTYRVQNEIKLAQQHYSEALRINWSTTLAYEISEFYYKNFMFEQALKTYEQILNYDQSEEQAFFYKIHILSELEQYEEALSELQRRKNYSNFPENLDLNMSSILIDMGEKEKGIAKLKQMVHQYSSSNAAQTLALIYFEEKDYNSADHWAALVNPNSEIYEQALMLRLQMFVEQELYSQAITLLTSHIDNYDPAPAMFGMLASLYINNEQYEDAEITYRASLDLFPGDSDISYEFALFLDRQNRINEALAIMELVLEADPENADALNFIGYTWADNSINLEKALEYTIKASQLKPNNGYIRDSVGWCYYRLNNFSQAVIILEEAVNLAPDDPHIQEHLGDAYLANKQLKDAYKAYLKSHKLHQDEDKKERVQKKIDDLQAQL